MTGQLNGTSASFSENLTAPNLLYKTDVINNLTSTSTTQALSANQGKVLQDTKLNLTGGTMTGTLNVPSFVLGGWTIAIV